MRFIFYFICLLALSSEAWTATDPISWSVSGSFQNPLIVGRSSSVTYTFTSNLPATMTKPIVIGNNSSPASDFTYTDNCSGQRLAPSQSCTVQVTLTPQTTGTKSAQLTFSGYDNNILNIPAMTTTATGSALTSVFATVKKSLPNSTTAGTSQPYEFKFTNTGSTISNVAITVTQTSGTPTYTTNCGSSLSGGCTVAGNYTPTNTPSVQAVTAQMSYGSGSSVSASTSTNVSATSGVTAAFVDSQYLPAVMAQNTSQAISVLFTNNTGANVQFAANTPASSLMTITTGGTLGNITGVTSSCGGVNLPNGAACEVSGTLNATSTGAITVTTAVAYTGGPGTTSIATSTSVVSSLGTSRTITVVNNCPFNVVFSLNGGEYPNKIACSPAGSNCLDPNNNAVGTCASNGYCYFKNYAPNSGSYTLTTSGPGNTTYFTIPTNTYTNEFDQQWSGNISASLNCNTTSQTCQIADCGNKAGAQGCVPSQGFSQPATQAEFTLLRNGNDAYDVETINGFTLPISMAPDAPVNVNNYTCGTAADPLAGNGFGACDWTTAVVPNQKQFNSSNNTVTNVAGNGYYRVTGSGTNCSITTGLATGGGNCPVGTVCGLDSSFNQVCGNFLGYWTADQVCGSSNLPTSVQSYFMCNQSLPQLVSYLNSALGYNLPSNFFPTGSLISDILLCSVPTGDTNYQYNTCYNSYSGVPSTTTGNQITCCGCVDWWNTSQTGGTVINSNSSAQSCTQTGQSTPQTNPVWNQFVQYSLQWMKKACPSAYTYPFDDKTSGYSCTNTLPGQPNSTNYTITFCAGNSGLPALPAGLTEGRTNP